MKSGCHLGIFASLLRRRWARAKQRGGLRATDGHRIHCSGFGLSNRCGAGRCNACWRRAGERKHAPSDLVRFPTAARRERAVPIQGSLGNVPLALGVTEQDQALRALLRDWKFDSAIGIVESASTERRCWKRDEKLSQKDCHE